MCRNVSSCPTLAPPQPRPTLSRSTLTLPQPHQTTPSLTPPSPCSNFAPPSLTQTQPHSTLSHHALTFPTLSYSSPTTPHLTTPPTCPTSTALPKERSEVWCKSSDPGDEISDQRHQRVQINQTEGTPPLQSDEGALQQVC